MTLGTVAAADPAGECAFIVTNNFVSQVGGSASDTRDRPRICLRALDRWTAVWTLLSDQIAR